MKYRIKRWSSTIHLELLQKSLLLWIIKCSSGLSTVDISLDYIHDHILRPNGIDASILETNVRRVDDEHHHDVFASSFVTEKTQASKSVIISDPINVEGSLLAQCTRQPLISTEDRRTIIEAAEAVWEAETSSSSSRFTIQRPGNLEVHSADLKLAEILNPLLQDRIYPWLRDSFHCPTSSPFVVYDSLVIRYNATEANLHKHCSGASQPLHKDLGLYSVNILLSDPNEFDGGGTFFEHQLLQVDDEPIYAETGKIADVTRNIAPLQPKGAGYALAHESRERHAGASTIKGVRDIMVFFIFSSESTSLRSPRLKNCLPLCGADLLCRLQHHYLACRSDATDGEAFLYLATVLLEFVRHQDEDHKSMKLMHHVDRRSMLHLAFVCLQASSHLCPCDSRVFNNMGLVLSKWCDEQDNDPSKQMEMEEGARTSFRRCLNLLEQSLNAGCDVRADINACRLNYSLFLSTLNDFEGAIEIMEPCLLNSFTTNQENDLVAMNIQKLYDYCQKRVERLPSRLANMT